ncbi:hypothetical protein [Bradyrhizobium sp. CCGE-LA001]|uniref:hypothetical protein n=1 Tax=Bradyrhizobium sp. CCGE-LA001 TaxID=1223566 RepID=UPI0002AADC72|nr:hypothetical protein [Bradyrhizobium sp. CCGE-LA001]AMA60142.1 hypothetical protein BCCGELA001_30525 [Bradyrhizobium sp. CCGE-LA001]
MAKPGSTEITSTNHVVGRTPWDFLSDALRTFGILAPLIIVSCLAVYVILQFQAAFRQTQIDNQSRLEVINRAYKESIDNINLTYKDRMVTSGDTLIKTYDTMATVSSAQVDQIKKLFQITADATSAAEEARKKAGEENAKAIMAAAEQLKTAKALEVQQAELAQTSRRLEVRTSEFERIKKRMQELVKLANAEEWEGAIQGLNDLLSEFGLRFDSEALSKLAKLSEGDDQTEEAAADEEIAANQIRSFANTSRDNLELVQQWLSKNGLDVPVALFLRAKYLEQQKKMIQELKMPIVEVPRPQQSIEMPEGTPLTPIERRMPATVIRSIQQNLCVPPSGAFDPQTREAIQQAKFGAVRSGAATAPFDNVEDRIVNTVEAQLLSNSKACNLDSEGVDRGYRTAFEKFAFADISRLKLLQSVLAVCDPNLKGRESGVFDAATRNAIRLAKSKLSAARSSQLADLNSDDLSYKSYRAIALACL